MTRKVAEKAGAAAAAALTPAAQAETNRLDPAAETRAIEAEAAAWRSCFGDQATGSIRRREKRALRIASTRAVLLFLDAADAPPSDQEI